VRGDTRQVTTDHVYVRLHGCGREERSLLAYSRLIIYNTFLSDLRDPVAVPDLKEVKSPANHLHSLGKHWQGEIFGW
jgi:hypothetical protein